jgi:hypothetical protein
MAYDIMGADDILGADDLMGADDILGADELLGAQRRRSSGLARRPSLFNKVPGVSGPALAKLPLGFNVLSCTSVANSSGGQAATRPQVPVIPQRLVVSVSGVNSGNYAVTISNIRVGTKSILASANPIDARAFGPGAFGVELVGESAQPGIDITCDYVITPTITTVGDRVDVATTFICQSVI